MSDLANDGGMPPEQVFLDGSGSGLANAAGLGARRVCGIHVRREDKQPPDTPAIVAERYAR